MLRKCDIEKCHNVATREFKIGETWVPFCGLHRPLYGARGQLVPLCRGIVSPQLTLPLSTRSEKRQ